MTASVDLADLPVVDDHGHPLLADPLDVAPETFVQLFTEGRPGTMTEHVAHAGYFQRTIHELCRMVGSEPTVEAVLAGRRRAGLESIRRAFEARRIDALIIDTGYPPTAMPLDEMRRVLPCAIHEILRIESVAQGLLPRALGYDAFVAAFRGALEDAARRAVAFKSVIAYRSGLAVRPWSRDESERAYHQVLDRVAAGGSTRLEEKPLLDTLFVEGLQIATEAGRPIQVHAGWGDPDVDLPQANPVLLRPIFEDPRWSRARIVVLHQAYPYFREAAFAAAVWPQVYLDLSLAIPYLGPGVVGPLVEILSLAPSSKLLYGSDVQGIPELFALSADWARAGLGEALGWLDARGAIPARDARTIARRILADNSRTLYRL